MTDRHGFHDHYGKDRPKDTEGKLDVDDPDMSKRPICTECGRKTYPWDFASKAWHKAHPKKNYCQASRSVDGTGDSPHMDWHIDCDGKDLSIGIGVVKDTEGKKDAVLKAVQNVKDNLVLYGTHYQGGREKFLLDCPCLVFALSEARKAMELLK